MCQSDSGSNRDGRLIIEFGLAKWCPWVTFFGGGMI